MIKDNLPDFYLPKRLYDNGADFEDGHYVRENVASDTYLMQFQLTSVYPEAAYHAILQSNLDDGRGPRFRKIRLFHIKVRLLGRSTDTALSGGRVSMFIQKTSHNYFPLYGGFSNNTANYDVGKFTSDGEYYISGPDTYFEVVNEFYLPQMITLLPGEDLCLSILARRWTGTSNLHNLYVDYEYYGCQI